ncbi:gamma-glutamylcyclotransferase [Mesorhizobium sp. M0830]|uniref:gamma-glutamylcyclotransferase n=1 Tax=Mesorhizobium sp. M0830 TaxID=2957008 RepID=UPI003336DEF6
MPIATSTQARFTAPESSSSNAFQNRRNIIVAGAIHIRFQHNISTRSGRGALPLRCLRDTNLRMVMKIALTEDLVAKVGRKIDDAGPAPGQRSLEDHHYLEIRRRLLAGRPRDVWVFAYGSLLWNPCFEALEERPATVDGWHRRFSLWLTRWRGTRDRPGLMLALDRGGSCRGVIYRLSDHDIDAAIDRLLRREMLADPPTNIPRWVSVRTADGNLRAIAFVADRSGPGYAPALPEQTTVEILSLAAGHVGSCADYLRRTVVQLEARNIRDATLWRLQGKVAAYLASLQSRMPLPPSTVEIDHACEG